jgi:hypothetical protein
MKKISYRGYRFPSEIIQQAIWLYLRFTLSFRDVEDLLAERGIMVSYETVRRWMNPHALPRRRSCHGFNRHAGTCRAQRYGHRPGGVIAVIDQFEILVFAMLIVSPLVLFLRKPRPAN